jgi:hypothetical protein
MRCPGCCSCGVSESSAVPFRMRVILAFRDIIYVINILYSWHLVIYEHFLSVCVERLILGIHTMSTWFFLQNRYDIGLQGVASPSLPIYGGAGLDPIRSHTGAPTRPCEPGVHDGGGASNLSCAQGPHISHVGGGIRGGLRIILQARVRLAITLIPHPISSALCYSITV